MILTIGMSVYDSIKVDTVQSLFGAISGLRGRCKLQLAFQKGTYIHNYRENLVERAREGKATHLLFVDADMTFPAETFAMLLDRDKDIIGGSYVQRSVPFDNTVKHLVDGKIATLAVDDMPADPFPCLAVGTGVMLIKMSVFDRLQAPYFRIGDIAGEMVGEDVNFCMRAGEMGAEVWCDPTIPLGHIGEQIFYPSKWGKETDEHPSK